MNDPRPENIPDVRQILLAEDNAADVTLVREALKAHGVPCTLRVVKDGAEAIAYLELLDRDHRKTPLDLLLLDMHLPKHDGADILRALRSTERYAQTPVIVMTASESPNDQEAAEKHAALHYFRKPSTLAKFLTLGGIVKDVLAGNGSPSLREPEDGSGGGAG